MNSTSKEMEYSTHKHFYLKELVFFLVHYRKFNTEILGAITGEMQIKKK